MYFYDVTKSGCQLYLIILFNFIYNDMLVLIVIIAQYFLLLLYSGSELKLKMHGLGQLSKCTEIIKKMYTINMVPYDWLFS